MQSPNGKKEYGEEKGGLSESQSDRKCSERFDCNRGEGQSL